MATMWPRSCRARAMRSLSSGSTRLTTTPSRSRSAPRTASSWGRSRPFQDKALFAEQADLASDGPSGRRVITGDHGDAYAGTPASGDGLCRAGTGRILEADEAEQLEVCLRLVG